MDTLNPKNQGPTEASIVASGQTVERWKRKHPNGFIRPMDPEDPKELTMEEVERHRDAKLSEVDRDRLGLTHPASDAAAETPSADSEPGPWHSMSSHAALDDHLATLSVGSPEGWKDMTLVQKRAWLDENA